MTQNNIFSFSALAFSLFLFTNADVSFANELKFEGGETLVSQNETSANATQTQGNLEVDLDELRIPDAPALNIIGSPKIEISKPGTPRAFGLSLIESFSDSDSAIPQNFAIDVAPYWWKKRTFNTLDCKVSKEENPSKNLKCDEIGFGENLIRSLTLSIASAEEDFQQDGIDVDLTRVGFGLRFSLLPGDVNPAFVEKFRSIPGQDVCNTKTDEDGETILISDPKERKKCIDKNKNALIVLAKELQELNATRVGWQLDFALASALDFEDDNFDNAEFTRLGTWLTASHRSKNSDGEASSVTLLGIARYLYDDFEDEGDSLFDLGGRFIWSPTNNPLSASVEYLRRFGDDGDDRLVGLAEYKFNDTYSIFASFGKGFEENFTGNDDLVTLLGINFGLGQKPKAVISTP